MSEATAYIGFGANLGDPIQQILDARRHLAKNANVFALEHSALYLTSPIGYEKQPDFVNCVSAIETNLPPQALLALLQNIENLLGRNRDPDNQNSPRIIDLDLLLFGTQNINEDSLVVPHPRLETRLFTLLPLSELDPKLSWSDSGNVSDILKNGYASGQFDSQQIVRLT